MFLLFISRRSRVPTLEKIESGKVWSPMMTPTLMRTSEQEKIRDNLRLDDLKISTPKVILVRHTRNRAPLIAFQFAPLHRNPCRCARRNSRKHEASTLTHNRNVSAFEHPAILRASTHFYLPLRSFCVHRIHFCPHRRSLFAKLANANIKQTLKWAIISISSQYLYIL